MAIALDGTDLDRSEEDAAQTSPLAFPSSLHPEWVLPWGVPGLADWASRSTQGVRLEAQALGPDRLEFKSIVPLPLKTIHPAFLNLFPHL